MTLIIPWFYSKHWLTNWMIPQADNDPPPSHATLIPFSPHPYIRCIVLKLLFCFTQIQSHPSRKTSLNIYSSSVCTQKKRQITIMDGGVLYVNWLCACIWVVDFVFTQLVNDDLVVVVAQQPDHSG